ncbi:MAG: alpha/beta hydrolase [Christensenella sp.]|uniref:alpha/beta hydrolase n=1 Tax=Christensenella sp. TaxID=1935934 RepID=UPI002B1F7B4F|nr:alpha/beta hydrolase [Christensenella sp.]MEA5004448.1 alpha/beta hydrolase [Christensenella sp.]
MQNIPTLQTQLLIEGIPSILWGQPSEKLWIAVHGNLSHKQDTVIRLFAEQAVCAGYQVLSFDLPAHGERSADDFCGIVQSLADLRTILAYANQHYKDVCLFACSIGAYFSLLTYSGEPLKKALFLSPVVNMQRILYDMMRAFDISEKHLREERHIPLSGAPALDWDYFCYVKEHPIADWPIPTAILCGEKDELCACDTTAAFAQTFGSSINVLPNCTHFFHTPQQLSAFCQWLCLHI